MPDKVWFATTNWKEKARPLQGYFSPQGKQAEWDAYNSSKFNGFPFPTIELNERNLPFSAWDGKTVYEIPSIAEGQENIKVPSESASELVTVLSPAYTTKFTYDQLFKLFWRMKTAKVKLSDKGFETSIATGSSSRFRKQEIKEYQPSSSSYIDYLGVVNCPEQSLSLTTLIQSNPKDDETKLISELKSNVWEIRDENNQDLFRGSGLYISFNLPVLKTGANEYRPYINFIDNITPIHRFFSAYALYKGYISEGDLPDQITLDTNGTIRTYTKNIASCGGCSGIICTYPGGYTQVSGGICNNAWQGKHFYVGEQVSCNNGDGTQSTFTPYIVISNGDALDYSGGSMPPPNHAFKSTGCSYYGKTVTRYGFWRVAWCSSARGPYCSGVGAISPGCVSNGGSLSGQDSLISFPPRGEYSTNNPTLPNTYVISPALSLSSFSVSGGGLAGTAILNSTTYNEFTDELGTNRMGLRVWAGTATRASDNKAFKMMIIYNNSKGKFYINYIYKKIGRQDDPKGSYEGGFTVS